MKTRFSVVFLLVFMVTGSYAFAQEQEPQPLPPEYAAQIPQEIKDQIEMLTGQAVVLMAKALGVTELRGKDVDPNQGPPGSGGPPKLRDVGIGITSAHENEPSVAANPTDKKFMVAASHKFPAPGGVRCVVFTSDDRGETWSSGFLLPQLPGGQCSDPVVTYAPNGSRVYVAYMDIKFTFNPAPPVTFTIDFDIVESFSNDNGATWTGPIIALDGALTTITFSPFSITPGFIYDKPWIDTHRFEESESNFVYVTATRFDEGAPFNCRIAFTRSATKGTSGSWSSPTLLESSSGGCGAPGSFVVQGSRPAGGSDGNVLVAWYNSGTDGFLNGAFRIRARRSPNRGGSFDPVVTASTDSFELGFFLGPNELYEKWWPGMMPALAIDPKGGAHILYTHSPVNQNTPAGFTSAEQGDIRYVTSENPPYTAWSPPVTVNDDGLGRAQGFPALRIDEGGNLHAVWYDSRLSPSFPTNTFAQCISSFPSGSLCKSPNLFYDIFYSRNTSGRATGWFRNFRVSDTSSIADFIFLGDYNDLAWNDTVIFAIWTDRRHHTSIFQFEDNVFGSEIIRGGGTP